MLIAGGTGFYPFMDLIDILFKQEYLSHNERSSISKKMRKNDPIVTENIVDHFNFDIYVAINSAEDLHPISLYQINYLCEKNPRQFKATFKVKEDKEAFSASYRSVKMTNDRFDKLVIPEAQKKSCSKVYICGPPIMNTSTANGLYENEVPREKV